MSSSMRFTLIMSLLMFVPFAWHFGTVFEFWGTAPVTRADLFLRLGVIVVFAIVSAIALSIFMAARSGEDEFVPDEREHIVLQKAERNGYLALSAAVVFVIWFAFFPVGPMDIANALIFSLCLAEFVKVISGLYYLKRGV